MQDLCLVSSRVLQLNYRHFHCPWCLDHFIGSGVEDVIMYAHIHILKYVLYDCTTNFVNSWHTCTRVAVVIFCVCVFALNLISQADLRTNGLNIAKDSIIIIVGFL